jgi:uncharacterized protein YraI
LLRLPVIRTLDGSVTPTPESPEGRARGISGVLRHERTAERTFNSPHHPNPRFTMSPAVRSVWTATLLALFVLISTGVQLSRADDLIAVVTDPDGVNLRGGPGTGFTSLAVIPKDTQLPVIGPRVNDRWLPVLYQARMGFVFDEFIELRPATPAVAQRAPLPVPAAQPGLSPSPSPSPSPAPALSPIQPSQPVPAEMQVASPDGVNLRSGPAMDQRVITVIPNKARVQVIGRSTDGKWVNVTYNGLSGWVDAQYLGPVDDRSSPSPSPTPAPGMAAGSARYIWPVSGRSITAYFSGAHPGVDIDQYPSGGNPVVATAAGRVTFAGGNPCCSYGLYVMIEHDGGAESLYAHLDSIDVREGQTVVQGQTLGRSGNTGRSTGAHLHFEFHQNGGPVDPLGVLPR